MEFSKKLQELRKQKSMTQEQLAEQLYVSRTAISKWESGRGYPSIDSLKAMAGFFNISLDDLLSGEEILNVAQEDRDKKIQHFRDIVFGLLDCAMALFLFLPLFGRKDGDIIKQVPLFSTVTPAYVTIPYLIMIISLIMCGVLTLALQNFQPQLWRKIKGKLSLGLSAIATLLFMITLEPYVSMFTFVFLVIKALMLIKWA
ncbi:MAG: helix-turn-helix transcriptional regulator [Eubacteriales bacterium]|nr:helix-turn-helix transcriptional regulator [Eubacteriales bacterium]